MSSQTGSVSGQRCLPHTNACQPEGAWSSDSYSGVHSLEYDPPMNTLHPALRTEDSLAAGVDQGDPYSFNTRTSTMYITRSVVTTVGDGGLGFNAQGADHYRGSCHQVSHRLPGGPVAPFPEYSLISSSAYTRQGHSNSFVPHPIPGMVAELGHGGDVLRVYGPPLDLVASDVRQFSLLWEGSRTMVPQYPYQCRTTRKGWDKKPTIRFVTWGSPGVRLVDGLRGGLGSLDDKGGFPFDVWCNVITIRLHFPGYCSSTDVEKTLKKQDGGHSRPTARSMQVSTKNHKHKVPARQVTKQKLVQEVSKRIWWHISDLENNGDLFPFDRRVGGQWRLGQGNMKLERIVITGLRNVSFGSWSPIIYIE